MASIYLIVNSGIKKNHFTLLDVNFVYRAHRMLQHGQVNIYTL